jgi:twitching motility protein PilT
VKDIVLNGEEGDKTYDSVMTEGRTFGMTTFDEYIIELYEKGMITQETALTYATHRAVVGRGVDSVKSSRGEKTTDIESLEIDRNYHTKIRR